MATPSTNGPVVEANGSPQKLPTHAQHQSKASFNAKMQEGTRSKQEEDLPHRRVPQPKAWTSGVNPITQRSNSSSQMNGASGRSSGPGEKSAADRQAWVYSSSVGLECSMTTKAGDMFTGVLAGAIRSGEDQKVAFKMVKGFKGGMKDGSAESGGQAAFVSSFGEYCGVGPDHIMVFPASTLQILEIPEAAASTRAASANGASGFRTDADISGNLAMRERSLQRWEAPSAGGADMSLDSNSGSWDQFKANEEQFGVRTDYDENLYTTAINKQSPLYAMRAREAERIAREIEGGASNNAHVREERGQLDDGVDEEERYSTVRRDYQSLQSNQPGKYVPPSRRGQVASDAPAAAALPAPAEGSVDPAIISSQMARPEQTEAQKANAPQASIPAKSTPQAPPVAAAAVPAVKEAKAVRQPAKAGALATDNVEMEVLDSFRQFAANEKIKVQDHKRTRASADKAVKLNDLMKFSKNFKLLTPVPKDLVPILAKDESKQKEIVQKAQRNADSSLPAKATPLADQKSSRPLAAARWEPENALPGSDSPNRDRNRQGSATTQSSRAQKERILPSRDHIQQSRTVPSSTLSAKLSDHHRAHKAGIQAAIPPVLPIQDARAAARSHHPPPMTSPQKSSGSRGPSSATSAKFNAKAMEFKPTAPAFKPASVSGTTAVSSPKSGSITRNISPAGAPPKFFGDRQSFGKTGERPTPHSAVKQRMAEPAVAPSADGKGKPPAPVLPAQNGGFQYPYKTAPTWTVVDDPSEAPDYKETFREARAKKQSTPQPQASPAGGTMAHQYGPPPPPHHLQQPHGVPHVQQPHHTPHQMHSQPHHYNHAPHYEDNHMRPSASNSSSFPAPSPRVQHQNMAYHSPMPAQAQLAYPQHVPYPMQAPPMGARQFSNGPHMVPMQGAHLAPVMVHQHSGGGYMPQHMPMAYNGQMPIYPGPGPNPQMYGSPGQPSNGYPSPGRGAPMMMHQGSQQGQQPVYLPPGQYGQPVYAQQPPAHMAIRPGYASPQPHYAQNSYPQHHFSHQVHRTPSSGYVQPHQGHHQHASPQQGPPQPAGPAEAADEAKRDAVS